jgi:hypothetical protein
MRYSFFLAGLAAMATAAPMKHDEMADYTPYKQYTPYSAEVEAAAARMETGETLLIYFSRDANFPIEKRSPMKMADDVKYTVYPSYKPYGNYEPYSATINAAAAKMDMQKRHSMMMLEPTDSTMADSTMKRNTMHTDECLMAKDNIKRNMMHAEVDEDIPTSKFLRNPHTRPLN